MSVEEYLNTSFDGADCEYLEGEIVERNTGELQHGRLQAYLDYRLLQLGLTIQVLAAIRGKARRVQQGSACSGL
jgi:hypothetical protein